MNDVAAAYGWPPRTFRAASGRLFWIYDARGVGFAGGTGLIDEVTAIEVFRSGQYCHTTAFACQ